MKIMIKTGSYNDRRCSRPWIAKVIAWPIGKAAKVEWGYYTGSWQGGQIEIEAEQGDIILHGQKDYRSGKSRSTWSIVQPSGELTEVTVTDARKAWDAR